MFSKHLRMEISRMKYDIETEEEGEKSEYGKKRSGPEKRCSDGLTVVQAYHSPRSQLPEIGKFSL